MYVGGLVDAFSIVLLLNKWVAEQEDGSCCRNGSSDAGSGKSRAPEQRIS